MYLLVVLALQLTDPLCQRRDLSSVFKRDPAEEFSGREYLLDARDTFDDLEAREPGVDRALSVSLSMSSANPLNPDFW
jgi:hypothetical protein